MRVLAALLLLACATAPKGPPAAGAWAREVPVAVDEQVTGRNSDPLAQSYLRGAFVERLQKAGVRIVPQGTAGSIRISLIYLAPGPGEDAPAYTGDGIGLQLLRPHEGTLCPDLPGGSSAAEGARIYATCIANLLADGFLQNDGEKGAFYARHPEKKPEKHGKRLAVLEFRNEAGLDRAYFSDRVRQSAAAALWAMQVVTRETMLELLKSDDADDELQAGRALGADLIISGRISKLSGQYELTLHLLRARDGVLLSAVTATGADADALGGQVPDAVQKLVAKIVQ